MNKRFAFYSIYICGGYNTVFNVKECFKLDLSATDQGWVEVAPMLKGRFNHKLIAAKGLIYAIGGEGPFSEHDDIEVAILALTFQLCSSSLISLL